MKASVVGTIAALVVGFGAGVAQAADNYLIQLDDRASNDTITGNTYKNGANLIQSVVFPNDEINAPYTLWSGATLLASFDNQFNYYEPDGVTLSDTVEISGTAGDTFFQVVFLSDPNSLSPLPNGGVNLENGQFQPGVLAGIVSNGDFYNLQIASDLEVPEPATWAMMLLGAGLVGLVARRRAALALTA
ncbi:MAG: hypothetical protein JWO83_698 [Caulobacteraceae bacterium]|nr:hypothetical protein [Caulobacteraceae bacterium]